MRRALVSAAVPAAVLALALTGCTGEGGSSSGSDTGGDSTLTLAMNADITGWDPSNQPAFQGWAGEAVWDRLIKCDEFGKPEADIAEEWTVSDDNTSFTATIRDGMEFSDGTPVDSEAVAATFEFAGSNGGAQGDFAGMTIETPDAQTVTLTWPEPNPLIVSRICKTPITTKALLESGQVNDTPVGSGPYLYDASASTRGSIYKFTKNPDHWNADHYPYEHLELRVIESETATVSALKTGQIDGSLVTPQNLDEITASGLETVTIEGTQTTRLLITDHLGEKIPALGDLRVRQAMNMVFDKQAMVDQLYAGNGKPAAQMFREGSDAYIEGLEDPYPYDVEKAKELMAEAGYADGFDVQLPTLQADNPLMPYVTQQLGEINIRVEQVPLTGANAISDLLSGTYPVVLYQLGNVGDSLQDIDVVVRDTGFWNLSHQPDATVDELWQQILTGDEDQKKAAQQEINQYIVDQAWFAPMVYVDSFYAYDADAVTIDSVSDVEGLHPKLRDFQ